MSPSMLKTPSVMITARGGRCLHCPDLVFQVGRVTVGVAHDLRPGKAAAVDDAGMVELIGKDPSSLPTRAGMVAPGWR